MEIDNKTVKMLDRLAEVRATVEHHAKTAEVLGGSEAARQRPAAGCWPVATSRNPRSSSSRPPAALSRYRIDRWD